MSADQDELYRQATTEFGAPLARLVAACEANRAHREDLLQDIHLALWRSFARFRGECALRTWVYRVAHNTAATHVVRHKRAGLLQLVSLEELAAMPHEIDGERLADAAGVIEKVRMIVERLKAMDRDVLLLYLEGLEAADIAEVLGISPNHVSQKILRTKKVLQRHFASGDDHAAK
jgi:RNA polymerase sigma-70 factor (ECF subfamily)